MQQRKDAAPHPRPQRKHTLPVTNSLLVFSLSPSAPLSPACCLPHPSLAVCVSHPSSAISIFWAPHGRSLVQPVLDANIQLLSHLITDFHLVFSDASPPHPLPCPSVLGWHSLSPVPVSILILQLFLWVGLLQIISFSSCIFLVAVVLLTLPTISVFSIPFLT